MILAARAPQKIKKRRKKDFSNLIILQGGHHLIALLFRARPGQKIHIYLGGGAAVASGATVKVDRWCTEENLREKSRFMVEGLKNEATLVAGTEIGLSFGTENIPYAEYVH